MNVAGNQAMMAGCATGIPARVNEIPNECNRLDVTIDRLAGKVGSLQALLATVLRPCNTECGCTKEESPATDLGMRLRNYDDRLEVLNDALQNLIDRLEV